MIKKTMTTVTAVVFGLLATVTFVGAEEKAVLYTNSNAQIEEIEAERYESVQGKWEVEVEYDDEDDYKFYVYEIDSNDELIEAIANKLDISESEVEALIDIDDEDEKEEDEDEDEDEDDNEAIEGIKEIEAKRYEQVAGKWEIEVETVNDKEVKYYFYDVTSEEDLIAKIATGVQISQSAVKELIDYDDDSYAAEVANAEGKEDKEKKDKKEKDDKVVNENKPVTQSDQSELIKALVQVIIMILMQNNDTDIDLGELLKFL